MKFEAGDYVYGFNGVIAVITSDTCYDTVEKKYVNAMQVVHDFTPEGMIWRDGFEGGTFSEECYRLAAPEEIIQAYAMRAKQNGNP